jgi:hypothetical protein
MRKHYDLQSLTSKKASLLLREPNMHHLLELKENSFPVEKGEKIK